LQSSKFILADLLKEDTAVTTEKTSTKNNKISQESLKIPTFLDCTIVADANTVVYDNLTLKNVKGKLIVKDETARLENMVASIFGGSMSFVGDVSTKDDKPLFNMNLGMKGLDIKETFTQFEFLKKVAPIAGIVAGKIDADIKLDGKLTDTDLSPILNSLSGDIVGDLLNSKINVQNSQLLSTLSSNVKFVDLLKLDLNNKRIHLKFNNGKVIVSPFDVKVNDMMVKVSGEHGFDQQMDYNLDFTVPAKMLGSDIANTLAKLGPKDSNKFDAIPVKVGLVGSFSNPKVKTNMNEVITNLTQQIVDEQKNQLVNQGKDALKNLLGGSKENNATTQDNSQTTDEPKTTSKEEVVNKISSGLKDLFGKKKTEEK